ncbi:hypothetical protein M885DRAFT_577266 [Pelagophyceae sp. CCMP2097]|nr:hypothetical protein M885DRAFT_577266 [Pelagophyceae sp. CCMP2097]
MHRRASDGPPRNAAKKRLPDRDSSSEDDDQQKKRTRDRDYSSEDDDQRSNESTDGPQPRTAAVQRTHFSSQHDEDDFNQSDQSNDSY